MKNKKNLIFILLLIMFVNFTPYMSYAKKDTIKVHYFGTKACISCLKTEKHTQDVIKKIEAENSTININFIYHDIMNKKNEELLIKYNNQFNIKEDEFKLIPAIFIGDKALIGEEKIEKNLENILLTYVLGNFKYKDIDIKNTKANIMSLTTTGIILAGLLDGINPCSIAMMLFFISFATINKEHSNKKKVLWLGLSFSLGTFLAYFGIGIGLFRFIYSFINLKLVMVLFYTLLAIMSLYLAYINILDYKNIKSGNEEKIKNQLNKKTKRTIHNIIKKQSNKNKIYITAFIIAFIISFLEFFCTGQIYLPVITYMINNNNELNYVLLLVLYNIAFISPLLLITIFMYMGKEIIDVSTVLVTKLHLIKIIGAIFFIGVTLYSSLQIIKI